MGRNCLSCASEENDCIEQGSFYHYLPWGISEIDSNVLINTGNFQLEVKLVCKT